MVSEYKYNTDGILAIYTNNMTAQEWVNSSTNIMFPEIIKACDKLIKNKKLTKVICAIVYDKTNKAYSFELRDTELDQTIEELMEWTIETENYEYSQKLKELKGIYNQSNKEIQLEIKF